MRTPLIAVALVVLGNTPALAQDSGFGAKGGLNLATVDTEGDSGLGWRPTLAGGGFWSRNLTSWVDLQIEGLYALKGARTDEDGVTSQLLLDYVETPVLARFGLGGRYFAVAGPYAAFLVRARTSSHFGDTTITMDISDDVERFDAGLVAGGGAEFGSWILDARYSLGFVDIDKDTEDDQKIKNRVISVTLGIRF